MSNLNDSDPFAILGLPQDASETDIRTRYLELVRQYPPDQAPEKFQEIRAAYESAKDPLVIARQLFERPDYDDDPPEWEEAIEAQKHVPPKLTPSFLVSLGNKRASTSTEGSSTSTEHSSTSLPPNN